MAGVYSQIMTFVASQTDTFIASKTPLVAGVLKPGVMTLMSVYIILHGFAHIRGVVQEPFKEFMLRVIKMVAVYAIGINMLNYNEYIVDTFVKSPDLIAAAIAGSSDAKATMSTLDTILDSSFTTGKSFWDNAGVFNGNVGAYIAAFVCWAAGIIVTAYAAFLIVLSKVFLSIIVAVGPLFIIALFFEATSKFFEAWVAQLANYGLIVVLVTAANIFTIGMFESAATQAAALGGNVAVADVFPLVVTAIISLLVLAQVPQAAAGLAGGIAVSSYGVGRMLAGVTKGFAKQTVGKPLSKGGKAAGKYVGRKVMNSYRARRNKISGSGGSGSRPTASPAASPAAAQQRQLRAESRKSAARGRGAGATKVA